MKSVAAVPARWRAARILGAPAASAPASKVRKTTGRVVGTRAHVPPARRSDGSTSVVATAGTDAEAADGLPTAWAARVRGALELQAPTATSVTKASVTAAFTAPAPH